MLPSASIAGDFGTAVGVFAATIAVGGFLGHATPVLRGASDAQVRQATVIGGLAGCVASAGVVVLSALTG
jgi:hypothetical protein